VAIVKAAADKATAEKMAAERAAAERAVAEKMAAEAAARAVAEKVAAKIVLVQSIWDTSENDADLAARSGYVESKFMPLRHRKMLNVTEATLTIQSQWRRLLSLSSYQEGRDAIRTIQAYARGYSSRLKLRRQTRLNANRVKKLRRSLSARAFTSPHFADTRNQERNQELDESMQHQHLFIILHRGPDGLGIVLDATNTLTGIIPGGAAEVQGYFMEGDTIVAVDGIPLRGRLLQDVLRTMNKSTYSFDVRRVTRVHLGSSKRPFVVGGSKVDVRVQRSLSFPWRKHTRDQ